MNLEFELEKIILLITQKTGITFQQTHKESVFRFLDKRFKELKLNTEFEKSQYLNSILSQKDNSEELSLLINESTINETYFFREEKQFKILEKIIFPEYKKNMINTNEPLRLWSAACSSGEEAYSLKLIADYCNIPNEILATDINTSRLEILNRGKYRKRSIRMFDGESFMFLLEKYIKGEEVYFPPEISSKIETKILNLAEIEFEKNIKNKYEIIFIRNVFIYFTLELRYLILKVLTEKYLKNNGYIFVSMNEIAMLDERKLPEQLEKVCFENIYCLHKKLI